MKIPIWFLIPLPISILPQNEEFSHLNKMWQFNKYRKMQPGIMGVSSLLTVIWYINLVSSIEITGSRTRFRSNSIVKEGKEVIKIGGLLPSHYVSELYSRPFKGLSIYLSICISICLSIYPSSCSWNQQHQPETESKIPDHKNSLLRTTCSHIWESELSHRNYQYDMSWNGRK